MLMQSLLRALPDKAALLIVGDIDQLPSVGHQVRCWRTSSHRAPYPWHSSPRCSGRPPRAGSSRMPIASIRARCLISASPQLLLRAGWRSGKRCAPHHRTGEDADSQAVWPLSDPRHPGAVSDEPRRGGCAVVEYRIELQAALNPAGDRKVNLAHRTWWVSLAQRTWWVSLAQSH
jgi:exodeoxyribonuclease V alpha subunit